MVNLRKIFVVSLALAFVFGVPNAVAAARPKAGAACSPLNLKVSFQGKVFTCVKSGKKLKWNKGVSQPIKVNTTQPTIAPAVDIDHLTADSVYKRSRQEIQVAIENAEKFSNPIIFVVGSRVESWRVDLAKQQYADGIKLWSQKFKPAKVTVLLYSFPDINWAQGEYSRITGREPSASSISSCGPNFCGSATGFKFQDSEGLPNYFIEQGLGFTDAGLWNRATAVHEYTHSFQSSITPNFWQVVPWWAVEGSAQFYGEAVSYVSFDKDKSTRSGMHTQLVQDASSPISADFSGRNLKSLLLEANPEISVALMRSIEPSNNNMPRVGIAYVLGSYATEVLVAVYGQQKFVDFYYSFLDSADAESNFKKVYGMNLNDFYVKLTPYFAEMARLELK